MAAAEGCLRTMALARAERAARSAKRAPAVAAEIVFSQAGVSAPFAVDDGGSVTGIELQMGDPPETKSTDLAVTLGAYSDGSETWFEWFEHAGVRFELWEPIEGSTVDMPVGGGAISLAGATVDGHRAQVIAAAELGGVTKLALPSEILLTRKSPAHDATGVSRTPKLEWTAVPGAHGYEVRLRSLGARWIVSAEVTAVTVPDWPQYGLALERGETHRWTVEALMEPGQTPDDWLAPVSERMSRLRYPEDQMILGVESYFTTAP